MLPLEWALKEREGLITHGGCPPSWMPVFIDPLGVHQVVDCDSRQIFEFSSDDVPRLCYEDLVAMLRTLASAFEAGLFFVNERTGLLGEDIPRFFGLAASLNPGIEYWQTRRG